MNSSFQSSAAASILLIPDLAIGRTYLSRLSLGNPPTAAHEIGRLLEAVIKRPPKATDLFVLLEELSDYLEPIQGDMQRRYQGRPLPFAENEEAAFQQSVAVWEKMAKAYAVCAGSLEPNEQSPEYIALIATILHRCLRYTGILIAEYYRARRELAPGLWMDLHGYFASAEEWGVAELAVEESMGSGRSTHCSAAYVAALLLDLANPFALTPRNLSAVHQWAFMWADRVSVCRVDPDDLHLPPYVVELMHDQGLHPSALASAGEPGGDARYLETGELAGLMADILEQLRQGIAPTDLGLGEDGAIHARSLLEQLQRPWSQSALPRRFKRVPSSGELQVAVGIETIYFQVTGRIFDHMESELAFSRGRFDTLFTFRERIEQNQDKTEIAREQYPNETWQIINHSLTGYRIQRGFEGARIGHGQLLGVHPHDGGSCILGQVAWLRQEEDCIVAGISLLPGLPQGVSLRVNNGGALGARRAFLLPAVPAMKEEAGLVIPKGIYQPTRICEIGQPDALFSVRLGRLLHSGFDFDRVSYERV